MQLNPDFRDFILALKQEGADFLVVGAHALAAHGVPRATGDLDLWIRPDEENGRKVWQALLGFGAPVEAAGLEPSDLSSPDLVFQMGRPPRRIDLLTSISGVSFEEAWRNQILVEVDGIEIPCIGRADLTRNKTSTGRDKDLLDVESLRSQER